MVKIETIEQQLTAARAELDDAQKKLASAVEQAKVLSGKRAPLVRAKFRGDQKAEAALKKMAAEQFQAEQDANDLRVSIGQIEQEIAGLEHQYGAAVRDRQVSKLREFMAKRGEHAERIQSIVENLTTEIAAYVKAADDITMLVHDLGLPAGSTRALQGTPLLKDFVRTGYSSCWLMLDGSSRNSGSRL